MAEKIPTFTARRWTPLEVSCVAIGADPAAGFRAAPMNGPGQMHEETTETTTRAAAKPKLGDDPIAAGRRAAVEERKRAAAIARFEPRLGRAWAETYLAEDNTATVEQIRADALERFMAEEAKAPTSYVRGGDDYTDPNWRMRAMSDRLVYDLTGGISELPEAAREYMGLPFTGIIREFLEMRGENVRRLSRGQMISMAMETRGVGAYATHGTGDFPFFLQETGQRAILTLYEAWPAALKPAATRLTVRDFRTAKVGRAGEFPPLLPKPEFTEIQAGTPGAGENETYGVSTFARAFGWSREAMVNDDLGMYENFVRSIAMAITDLEANMLTAVLTGNALMNDGFALFSEEHGNLAEGAALSLSSVTSARKLMRAQKGVNGTTTLNIGPRYFISPAGLETDVERMLTPLYATTVEEANPFAGRLIPIIESRLDATDQSVYVAADPARMPALAYVVREGAEAPVVETEYDFATKGMAISVVHDFGATAIDWRGIAKLPPYSG